MDIEVLVVQHGEKVQASGDPALTETGERQAAAVAAWLGEHRSDVVAVWASPLRRAQQTAEPIAAAFGLDVQTDARLRERMNWDESEIGLAAFVSEWQRTSRDRRHRPAVGDSSVDAAARFIEALTEIAGTARAGTVVVVAHGGVTVDSLRTLAGDADLEAADPDLIVNGVPCAAITRLRVADGDVAVVAYPSTGHLADPQGRA